MVEGLDLPASPGPREPSSSSRSPLVFGAFVLLFAAGATLATLALAAALYFLGLWAALGLGAFVAVALPLFLVVRLHQGLKRRRTAAWVRHLLAALLTLITHAALFGICLDWVGRSLGDVFAVADTVVVKTVGSVPLLSGILRRGAEEATISLDGRPVPRRGDGGPLDDDGGPLAEGDGGTPAAAPDGGVLAAEPSPLSPRTSAGRPVRGVVSLVRTDIGGYAAVVTTLDAGGVATHRSLDLTPFASEGGPTAADAAKDGSAAFVTGGGSVVYAGAGESPRALPALARGAKLRSPSGARVIRAVRDVAIAPGGALLVVAEVVVTGAGDDAPVSGKISQALLAYHPKKPGAVEVLRQSGDVVPGAAEGSTSSGFALRRTGPAGRVAVVEQFLEGGDGASNDERLLAGRVDEPRLLQEVSRTSDAITGLPQRAVSSFGEASVLADGRVLFDASFVEDGTGGALLVGREGAPPLALAAEAFRDGKAPWTAEAPRAQHLVAEPDGRFAFVKQNGVVLSEVDRPLEATLLPVGVRVHQLVGDGATPLGEAQELFRPTLAQGGDWLLVGARLEGGRRALLLLSRDDAKKGAAEAVLVEGQPLPGGQGSIRSLMLYDWRGTPSNGTSP